MTNPPVNWGYPRTVEGFFHVLTRGQYERLRPTKSFSTFAKQLPMYGLSTVRNFGVFYLIAAVIPFCVLHKMRTPERRWMLGLLSLFAGLSLLMLVLLNPPPDWQVLDLIGVRFTPSHFVLALWAGYGLILLGSVFAREKTA